MQLYEVTTIVNEDGSKVVRIAGKISDRHPSDEEGEWIAFQLSIDEPIAMSDALLRKTALQQARATLDELVMAYSNLGYGR